MKTFFIQHLSQFAVLETFRRIGYSKAEIKDLKKSMKSLKTSRYDLMQDQENPTLVYLSRFDTIVGDTAIALVDKRHYSMIFLQQNFDDNYEDIKKAYFNDPRNN